MKKIYLLILIISLLCFSGCSSNKNTQNESSSQNTTNASNTSSKNNTNANKSGSTQSNMGNGIGNAVDNAGNLVGNVIDDAGTAIEDVGNNIESIVNGNNNNNSSNNSNMQLTKNSQNQVTNIKNTNNLNTQTSNTSNVSSNLSQRATQIAKDINSIDGVEKATVIITGETALIGLNLGDSLNDEQISNIKKLAETKTKDSNNGIKNAAVTASPEIVQRITNLANDIKEGKPISGLADELGNLIKRVTPTI